MEICKIKGLNPYYLSTNVGGVVRTIKAQYWKNSLANYVRSDGLGASAVLVICKRK